MSDLEVLHWGSGVVIQVGNILHVDVEHEIEMLLDESKVDWVRPYNCTSTILSDFVNLVCQISEVEVSQGIDLLTVDLDSTIVGVDINI